MSFHILFGAMCAVVTAYVAIAIIAIARAYRNDRRLGLGRMISSLPLGDGAHVSIIAHEASH